MPFCSLNLRMFLLIVDTIESLLKYVDYIIHLIRDNTKNRLPNEIGFLLSKTPYFTSVLTWTSGGEGEIRTRGTLRYTYFPGMRTRPLCDLSIPPRRTYLFPHQVRDHLFQAFNLIAVTVRIGLIRPGAQNNLRADEDRWRAGHLILCRGFS